MRILAALPLVALLLAGCNAPPSAEPAEQPAAPALAPRPEYAFDVVVTQETPDGPALAGAEVVAYVLGADGPTGTAVPASTDGQGVAHFAFREPTRLALRASLPGWTQEGTTVAVGDEVVVGDGLVASDRDVFLPLFRTTLRLQAALVLGTEAVAPDAMGGLVKPLATVDLVLPERTATAYLARLGAADVRLAWTETATEHADLSAGLAWDGRLWVEGDAAGPALLPGGRTATFSGAVPAEGRPADLSAATLQAAAVTNTAVVGDVPLAVEVELRFSGQVPPGLPAPCHATTCVPLPPLPLARLG